jgi:hypothetical protein
MVVVWGLLAAAWAGPCAEVPALVGDAWSAYEDAEVDRADELLDEAVASLGCQDAVVPTEDLLGLFRLSALVALSRGDRDGAVVHTIRALVVQPDEPPPVQYGPQLAELHQSWKARLGGGGFSLRVDGEQAWVDGRQVTSDEPVKLLVGEHLVQWAGPEGFQSRFVELTVDSVVVVGEGVIREDLGGTEIEDPEPPDRKPPPPDQPPREAPRHRVGLLVTGGLLTAAGAGVTAYAFTEEGDFRGNPYDDERYGGCVKIQPCYDNARSDQITQDAERINISYAIGYGVTALGVLTLGTELLLLPAPTEGGGSLSLAMRW